MNALLFIVAWSATIGLCRVSTVSNFEMFKAAFASEAVSEIRVNTSIYVPCETELYRSGGGDAFLVTARAQPALQPQNALGSCYFRMIFANSTRVSLSNLTFSGNVSLVFATNVTRVSLASVHNGAVRFGVGTGGIVANCSFSASAGSRALILSGNNSVSIVSSTLGPATGGCLGVSFFSTVSVRDGVFQGCKEGAAFISGSQIYLHIDNTAFLRSNFALANLSDSVVRVDDSGFSGCSGCIGASQLDNVTLTFLGVQVACDDSTVAVSGGGAAFTAIRKSAVVLQISLRDCDAKRYGGGLFISDAEFTSITIANSTLSHLGAVYGGAVAVTHASSCDIGLFGTSIASCISSSAGGGLYFDKVVSTSVQIVNATLSDLQSGQAGGAVCATEVSGGSSFAMARVRMTECGAVFEGGGLFLHSWSSSTVQFSDSNFDRLGMKNTPVSGGFLSADMFNGCHMALVRINVTNSGAFVTSAGILLLQWTNSSAVINSSMLSRLGGQTDATTPIFGAATEAFIWINSSFHLSNVVISDCHSIKYGAGLMLSEAVFSDFRVSNCSFSKLDADVGGAIYAQVLNGSRFVVDQSEIVDSDANQYGAGMALENFRSSCVEVVNSNISRVGQTIAPEKGGGAVYAFSFSRSSLVLRNSAISFSDAAQAAGIAAVRFSESSFEALDSTLSHMGKRTSPGRGGAIFASEWSMGGNLTLQSVSIFDCEAESGAGLYLWSFNSTTVSLINSSIAAAGQGVVTPQSGGAIFKSRCWKTVLRLSGTTISDCEAMQSGAGLFLELVYGGVVEIDNCTFLRLGQRSAPLSGGAVAAVFISNTPFSIRNSVFDQTAAFLQGDIFYFQNFFLASHVTLMNLQLLSVVATRSIFATRFESESLLSIIDCISGPDAGSVALESSKGATAEFVSSFLLGLTTVEWLGSILVTSCRFEESGTIMQLIGVTLVSISDLELTGRKSLSFQAIHALTLVNVHASLQTTRTRGACLFLSSVDELQVINSSFRDSSQTGDCVGCGGGALSLEGVSGRFENVVFRNISAAGVGGAVLVGRESNMTFFNTSFEQCRSGGNGGAMHVEGATLVLKNSRFEQCHSLFGDGGGISAYESFLSLELADVDAVSGGRGGFLSAVGCRSLKLQNISASECHARDAGGFLSCEQLANVELASVRTFNCSAASGGSISFDSFKPGAKCSGERVELTNSSSTSTGGCIQMYHSRCGFKDSILSNCVAPSGGGGAQLQSLSFLTGTNLTIEACTSASGAAVYASGGSRLSLRQSFSKNNHASRNGGGLFMSDANFDDVGSIFEGNSADANGGTMFFSGSSAVMEQTQLVEGTTGQNGAGMYLNEGSFANIFEALFLKCRAEQSGGVLFVASDEQSSVLRINSSEFAENRAGDLGGAIALMDQSSTLDFTGSCSFSDNSAATGGAVYFTTLQIPQGLKSSKNSGNTALLQGNFFASGPVSLRIEPPAVSVLSGTTFALRVSLLDYSGAVVAKADATCVRLTVFSVSGDQVAVVGGSGSFEEGVAAVPSMMLKGRPGSSGTILATVKAYGLNASLPFLLRNCSVGEIFKSNECIECEYGTYALSTSAPSCLTCPDGAVCVNGSRIVPKWGYWRKNGTAGVCSADDSCSLPECRVKDACYGVRSVWIKADSAVPVGNVRSFAVASGYSGAVARAARSGDGVLLAKAYWTVFVALNCSGSSCRLFLTSASAWPMLGWVPLFSCRDGCGSADTVESQLFVSNRTCHHGFQGNLCSDCASGYGRTSNVECGKCEGTLVTILLTLAFVLAGIVVVAFMSYSTMRNAGKKGSQLVSIAKVVWTYAQLMALCAQLPLSWPSAIMTLFRVQDAASSVDSTQFVSFDCLLLRLGLGGATSAFFHSLLLLLMPVVLVLLAGAVWWVLGSKREVVGIRLNDAALSGVRTVDKFFVTSISILFLLYPKLIKNSFSLFPCQELSTGESFMWFDLSTSCSSGAYSAAVAVGIVGVIVYALGIPSVSFFLVWRKRRLLHTAYARNTVGFLYLGYSIDCYYFESIVMIKKMLLGGIVLMSGWLGAELSVAASQIVLVVAYFLHIELKPFEDAATDRLERLATFALLVCTVSGLMFSSGSLSAAAETWTMTVLFLLNLAFAGSALWLAIPHFKRKADDPKPSIQLGVRTETVNPIGTLM